MGWGMEEREENKKQQKQKRKEDETEEEEEDRKGALIGRGGAGQALAVTQPCCTPSLAICNPGRAFILGGEKQRRL